MTEQMTKEITSLHSPVHPLAEQVGKRAANLFETRQLLCAEAILRAVVEAFGGTLSPQEAAALGSAFCVGMGGAGCTCGALSGGVASIGLYLGRKEGSSSEHSRALGKQLHDTFRAAHKSTCCRVLTRNLDKKAHFAQCLQLTEKGARTACQILLDNNVVPLESNHIPKKTETRFTALARNIRSLFR